MKRWFASAVFAVGMAAVPAASQAGVLISVNIAPPVLQTYPQPVCPGPGYIWTPGYWAYGAADYYWVPGAWVRAPQPGLLWTPPYWGWSAGAYVFHAGYWGPHIGFYGGVNYGYGYGGVGYVGGIWRGNTFVYNRAVTNVNVNIVHNVYNEPVRAVAVSRVSFNGGPGGVAARPSPAELSVEHEHHLAPTPVQAQHERTAFESHPAARPASMAAARSGERPAAAERPAERPAANARSAERPAANARPAERPQAQRAAAQARQPRPAEHRENEHEERR